MLRKKKKIETQDPATFDNKNEAAINVFLTKNSKYRKFNPSFHRILATPPSNLNKYTQNFNSDVRYANNFVKNPRKINDKMTRFDWSRNPRDSCPTSLDRCVFILCGPI